RNNSVFRSFFKKQKLTGPNFIDWYRQLRLVLSIEDKENYLEHPIPVAPVAAPGQQVPPAALAAHATWVKGQKEVDVLMLLTMDLEIKRSLAHLGKGKMGNASNNALFASKPKTPPPPKKITLQRTQFATNVVKLGIGEGTGLRGSKKLKPGALSLYVGDGHRIAVETIGTFHLEHPSGLVIVLNNYHYAPSITRGVISVSCLFDDGFVNRFDDNNVISVSCLFDDGFVNRFDDNNVISVSENNLVYFKAIPRDGIYEIDMSCSNTNDSSMYVITKKRAKIDLDSSLLWHYRLGHISKKRIKKLKHDGLLNSIDIESLGKGEYMSQEFLDHLKKHGIIAHRTPPYTPQHNEVSERRNRTLLDMVQWDYALETAARILNMVPTKKVDKTPYEIWHGQAPKLSYLKI
nr:zinc finger, CCHC-type [Tanacetum cinerariifolium]